jgi:hypothetical protein
MPSRPSWAGIPAVTEWEGFAIKALAKGEATPDQQQRAFKFIVERVSRVDEPSFIFNEDGGERATAFVEGRRSVGLFLKGLIALPSDKLRKPNA